MKFHLKWLLYLLYTFVAVIFFLYVCFPEKSIRAHARFVVENLNPRLTLSVSKAVPDFPLGVCLKKISLSAFGKKAVDADSMTVQTSFYSLFSRKNDFSFKIKAYGGDIRGILKNNGSTNGASQQLTTQVSGVRLENIPALDKLDYKISGQLNSNFKYRQESTVTADAILEIYDAGIKLSPAFFGPKFFEFKKANTRLSVRENVMKIIECELKGPQTDIFLSGIILLKQPLERSELKIKGVINPHLSFLRDLNKKALLKIFPEKRAGEKGFSFKMNGTIDRPAFFWE